jgi:hypothetical protein
MTTQLMNLFEDRRAFGEVFDVHVVDNIYRSANSAVVVFDKFGRKTREIFLNVVPKAGEEFDGFSPQLVAQRLTDFMHANSYVRQSDNLSVTSFPFNGLRFKNIQRYLRGHLPTICCANGLVVTDKVTPIRLPANALHVKLGNELVELRNLFKDGYRPHKLAQFCERWKAYMADREIVPSNDEQLAAALENLAATYDQPFEYWPEGVGIVFEIGGDVSVKYRKAGKKVLVSYMGQATKEFDLSIQDEGADLISHLKEVITGALSNGNLGIHDTTGLAAIEGLKERLANTDQLTAFMDTNNEFTVVRNDNPKHIGLLVTAKDRAGQTYLIFVLEKNGAFVRKELRTDDRRAVSDFYNVIAGYMEVRHA